MPATENPKTVAELVKLLARHGKKTLLVSGVDLSADRTATGKVIIDVGGIQPLHEITTQRDRVTIGTGLNLGRLSREAIGENGLIRQAASIIANPLVRNKITLVQALDPESPYFDITTPLVLLEAKIRLQGPSGRRTLPIREFFEVVTKGLKKGEFPIAIEFVRLPPGERVGFFRVARQGSVSTVSAAAKMKLVRTVAVGPEIVVSGLSLVPVRSKNAEKELSGKVAAEDSIKSAAQLAAAEVLELSESQSSYERSLIEIAVARTLRRIVEG